MTETPEKQIRKSRLEDGLAFSQVVESLNLEGSRVSIKAGKAGRQKHIIRTDSLRLGKDEMNLIEHPFAVLWQKEPNDNIMTLEWDARHPKTGKVVPASWSVAGHADFGLPTPTDERVYLVLLELTREAGFDAPTVRFSRYDICKRLGWHINSKTYAMLQGAFDRLKGVNITAKNAFWNPKSHSFRNTGFNIIDYYDINAEPPGRKTKGQAELPLSWFKWSDVMFDSFQSGYIRTLDLDFALSLKSDIALRLYRYLDKKAYNGRDTFEIELFTLCIEHLGMKPTKYPSKLKERLLKAHDELKSLGFLREVSYGEMKKPLQKHRSVKVCYNFNAHHLSLEQDTTSSTQTEQSEQPPLVETPAPDRSPKGLRERMMQIGVSPETVEEFLQTASSETLNLQLDCLRDRNPKDAAATFVKAVRENWAAPTKYTKSQSAETNEKARQAYIGRKTRKKRSKRPPSAKKSPLMKRMQLILTKFGTTWRIKHATKSKVRRATAWAFCFRKAKTQRLSQPCAATFSVSTRNGINMKSNMQSRIQFNFQAIVLWTVYGCVVCAANAPQTTQTKSVVKPKATPKAVKADKKAPELVIQTGTGGSIENVAISPDGKTIATGDFNLFGCNSPQLAANPGVQSTPSAKRK